MTKTQWRRFQRQKKVDALKDVTNVVMPHFLTKFSSFNYHFICILNFFFYSHFIRVLKLILSAFQSPILFAF